MAITVELFHSDETYVALNPKLSPVQRIRSESAVRAQYLKSHIWIASSGTENAQSNMLKVVALSKEAFLVSARGVCDALGITSKDVYYNTLPLFHVSGLATLARSCVAGCKHIQDDDKWKANEFVSALQASRATITSLVPTQVFDIVTQKIKAPDTLNTIFVGGGALSQGLASQAKNLGWKLFPTYGMTETAAMMAYQKSGESVYTLFPHITSVRTTEEQRLEIQSRCLLSGYLFVGESHVEFRDPKVEGWFTSGDKAILENGTIQLLGRESELVKIKGETVSLLELNEKLETFCLKNKIDKRVVVLAVPHARDGYELFLVSETEIPQEKLDLFNRDQMPFSRIAKMKTLSKIPTTPLGKVDISATRSLI